MSTWIVRNAWDTIIWEGQAKTAKEAILNMMYSCNYPKDYRWQETLCQGIYAYPERILS